MLNKIGWLFRRWLFADAQDVKVLQFSPDVRYLMLVERHVMSSVEMHRLRLPNTVIVRVSDCNAVKLYEFPPKSSVEPSTLVGGLA